MMLMRHARAPALRAATRPRFAAAGTHASRAFSTVPALEEGEGLHLPCTMLTDDESMMREAATQFAQGVVLPRVEAMDDAGRFDDDIISGLFEQGFMGVEIPEEYDGAGASFTSALLVIEELARVDPAVSVMVDIHNTIVNNTFSMWASPELKQQWLPRLATDTLGAFALSEASSGSDAFALKTTAVQDAGGGDYVLTGEKMWISNSLEAGVFLVMANADPSKGYKGITCFVVDGEAAGLSVGKKEDKLGIRASATCSVTLVRALRTPSCKSRAENPALMVTRTMSSCPRRTCWGRLARATSTPSAYSTRGGSGSGPRWWAWHRAASTPPCRAKNIPRTIQRPRRGIGSAESGWLKVACWGETFAAALRTLGWRA